MAVDRSMVQKVVAIVGTAGPVVAKYLRDHPEIRESVNEAVANLLRRRASGPDGMIGTIAALREQVHYLRTSADDAEESRRAEEWSRRLDRLEHAAQLLRDGGSRRETKTVKDKLTALRGEILAAFVAGQADDAEQRRLDPGGRAAREGSQP